MNDELVGRVIGITKQRGGDLHILCNRRAMK